MSNFEVKSQSSPMWNRNDYIRRNSGILEDGLEENMNSVQDLGGYGYRRKQRASPTSPSQGTWRYSPISSMDDSRYDKLMTENSTLQNQIRVKNVAIAELESTMSDKDDIIVDLEAQLAETEQFLEQILEERNESMPVDYETIFKHVQQLNELIADGSEMETYCNGATFHPRSCVRLTVYRDGFVLDSGPFRGYGQQAGREFMRDLMDGYFPSELQSDYPEGVTIILSDQRYKSGLHERFFTGCGNKLQSRPSSSLSMTSVMSTTNYPQGRPVSSQNLRRIHINDRPMSAPWRLRKSSSLQRLPPLINSIESDNPDVFNSSRQLFSPRVIAENSILEPLPKPATYASPKSPRSSIAKHTSRVKVIGLTDTPLVVDLLSFDTIRTLYRVIQSMLPAAKFRLYTGLPKIMVADKSHTLEDLGMVPRGVLYARGV
eukprot:TRINITY_DN17048_c0_g1_i2.p1 TRINITY_DN17048_c0_g1~~TRINITY_DN17048_c0_g1_i2.p1  ORF type:complete len:432 (+),score=99.02 TRINITY_DN17048_c0_g1_i2:121-1416(+)